jgi:hypothetical protein
MQIRSSKQITPSLLLTILGLIIRPMIPWLREEAKKSETPIDDWAVDFLDLLFPEK